MNEMTPAKVFEAQRGKITKTRNGWYARYVAGVRYVSKDKVKWFPSKYQDRNRNLAEQSDRGL